MAIVGSELQYGDKRTYISFGGKRRQCGHIRAVSYIDIADTVMLACRIHGSMRLRTIVQSMSAQLKINLDTQRVKQALGRNVVEKQFYTDDGVLVVEDWVVV